eukprot:m.349306 g.349306  ORF g.349306 m.349306 type:complete len:176 (-) comp20687_c0_seq12:502-1029(-)
MHRQCLVFLSPCSAVSGVVTCSRVSRGSRYNNLTYDYEGLTQSTPRDLEIPGTTGNKGFDVAFSISSFDHDGLGRYGDPINPYGDIEAMRIARCLLKPGSLLFLTIPVGPDAVVWNLHRRYGAVRLPHMLYGWEVVDVVGWSWAKLSAAADWRRSYEPVFVLRVPDSSTNGHMEL